MAGCAVGPKYHRPTVNLQPFHNAPSIETPTAVPPPPPRPVDFGTVAAEVKRARGVNAEALLQYRSSVLHAAEDVEDTLSLLVQSENRRNEILHEIAKLQRVRDLSEESYAVSSHSPTCWTRIVNCLRPRTIWP